MKHLKLYEDYSDEEIRNLIGNLHSVGQHELDPDVLISSESPETEREGIEYAESWRSRVNPNVFLTKIKGSIKEEHIDLEFYLSDGRKMKFSSLYEVGPHSSFDRDYAYFMFDWNGKKYDVKDKFFTYMQDESTIKSCLDIYDELEKGNL
jgi:hypothetical protein